MAKLCGPAWQDWAFFESSCWQIEVHGFSKYLMTLFAILKNYNFKVKSDVNNFCNLLKILGYFLFQHLVTLCAAACSNKSIEAPLCIIHYFIFHQLSVRQMAWCDSNPNPFMFRISAIRHYDQVSFQTLTNR